MNDRILRLGTRESALALYQTNLVAAWISPRATKVVGLTTAGDNPLIPLTGQGASGLFVNNLRHALSTDQVDVIVHSLKDLPTQPDTSFALAAVPERVDARDVFVGRDGMAIEDVPSGEVIGTSSPRRAAWVRRRRPDLRVAPIRGNVDTRLAKIARGEYSGTLLAAAGLSRLGLLTSGMQLIATGDLIPAPAQGALGVECRASDADVVALLTALDNREARFTATAERAVLRQLGASCATAAGAYSRLEDGLLTLRADVMSTENLERILIEYSVACPDLEAADAAGMHVAEQLIAAGAEALVNATTR